MTNEKKAEIAVRLIEFGVRKKARSVLDTLNRDLGNTAKDSGISLDELKDFIGPIIREVVSEMFPSRHEPNKSVHNWHK